jgi:hypothetical protein
MVKVQLQAMNWPQISNHFAEDFKRRRAKASSGHFQRFVREVTPNLVTIANINGIDHCLQENMAWMNMLPNVKSYLRLFLIIAVTSCRVERSFSPSVVVI